MKLFAQLSVLSFSFTKKNLHIICRKKLRRNSDLKHFDDAEEILGAMEHFWHNLKRMKAKNLLLAFLGHDEINTIKMLLSFAKYQIYDLNKMTKVFKILKDLNSQDKCPDEDFLSPKKDKIPFPHLNVDFQTHSSIEPSINRYVSAHSEGIS